MKFYFALKPSKIRFLAAEGGENFGGQKFWINSPLFSADLKQGGINSRNSVDVHGHHAVLGQGPAVNQNQLSSVGLASRVQKSRQTLQIDTKFCLFPGARKPRRWRTCGCRGWSLGCSVLSYPRDRKINWYELKSVTQNQKVCIAFRKTQQYDHSEKVSGQPGGWFGCPETFLTYSIRSVFQKAVHTFEICSYSVTVWFLLFNGFWSDVRSRSFIFAISQFGHNLDRLRLRNCPGDIFGPQQLQKMWKYYFSMPEVSIAGDLDSSAEHPRGLLPRWWSRLGCDPC